MASTQVADPPTSDVDDRFAAPTAPGGPVRVEQAAADTTRTRPVRPADTRRRTNRPSDAPPPVLVIRAMLGLGRTLMVIGILLLLFAGFQLWGTGLSEARAQAELTARFEQRLADAAVVGPAKRADPPPSPAEPLVVELPGETPTGSDPINVGREPTPMPMVAIGDPIGVLSIPAIDLTKTFSAGTSRDVLRSGPGHYSSTPLPGQGGNIAIAGHRTTHGAPFLDIDQLEAGDAITVETVTGTYTYAVEGQLDGDGDEVGHRIVAPEDVDVIMDKGDDRLTLTACHPKYSARQRIIVTAVLISGPPPPPAQIPDQQEALDVGPLAATAAGAEDAAPPEPEPEPGPEPADRTVTIDQPAMGPAESLGWQPGYVGPTAAWALATGLIALLSAGLGRLWRRFPAYLLAVPPASLSLYYCFVNLERFIPAV